MRSEEAEARKREYCKRYYYEHREELARKHRERRIARGLPIGRAHMRRCNCNECPRCKKRGYDNKYRQRLRLGLVKERPKRISDEELDRRALELDLR